MILIFLLTFFVGWNRLYLRAKRFKQGANMSDINDEDGVQGDVKQTRQRSPNFPVIGLRKAVEKATELETKYKRSLVPIHLVVPLWDLKPNSTQGDRFIAALKTYGLLDVEGEAKNRRVKLTDSAIRIIGGAQDKPELLKLAALKPALNAELWEKYREGGLPDNDLIKHYLVWDRDEGKFNPDSVDTFIANFRDTLAFAGLGEPDKIDDEEANKSAGAIAPSIYLAQQAARRGGDFGKPSQHAPPDDNKRHPQRRPRVSVTETGVREEVFSVPSGGDIVVQWPDGLTIEDIADFEDWIKIFVRKAKRSIQGPVSAKRFVEARREDDEAAGDHE
jgi:hypothetical protein